MDVDAHPRVARTDDESDRPGPSRLGAQLSILLACELPHLVRSIVVVSSETQPAPLHGPTLALLGQALPLSRRRWFATAQARQLGIPDQFLEDYLRDSITITRETLLSSVSENIRFTIPAAWAVYQRAVTVLVMANERKLMHNSGALTVSALKGSTLVTVQGAAHDIPLSQPGIIASELHRQITELTV